MIFLPVFSACLCVKAAPSPAGGSAVADAPVSICCENRRDAGSRPRFGERRRGCGGVRSRVPAGRFTDKQRGCPAAAEDSAGESGSSIRDGRDAKFRLPNTGFSQAWDKEAYGFRRAKKTIVES